MGKCPNCQSEIDAEDKFCRGCGKSLIEEPPSRFRSIVPTENLEGYRQNYFRPFFITALALIVGLFAIAGILHLIRASLTGP